MRELPSPTLPFAGLPSTPDPHPHNRAVPRTSRGFEIHWARSEEDVRQAQRLRHKVFVEELGAKLQLPPGTPDGHDVDEFDPYCEHLLARARPNLDEPGEVVGTYRILTPSGARSLGHLYTDLEFDLGPLAPLRQRTIELGRSCVHPDWRSGGVIMMLWSTLVHFMLRNALDTMIGCASVSLRDGGHTAASLWEQLRHRHLVEPEWRVTPRLALPVWELQTDLPVQPPPLIHGYLRCGAQVLGPPAWDPDFNTADLPMILQAANLPARYHRRQAMVGSPA